MPTLWSRICHKQIQSYTNQARIQSYESIDGRIAIATFKLTNRTSIKIVNVYGPTQAKSNNDERVRDAFYNKLETVLSQINKQATLFIAGDFNSKIKVNRSDTNCNGKYGRG